MFTVTADTHRDHGILHARVPAVEPEKHDAGGHGPDAGVEIVACTISLPFMAHRASRPRGFWKQNNQQAEHRRTPRMRPDEHVGAFAEVSRAERLGRESAGSHAHERAVPVDEVEDGYADGECADRRCGVCSPGVRRRRSTHDTHKGDGDVGDDVRERRMRRISRFMSWVLMRKYTALTGTGKYSGTVFRSDLPQG